MFNPDLMNKLSISKELLNRVDAAGGEVFLVGGALRDIFLGGDPEDIDLCITGLNQEEFQGLFPEAELVGSTFPVFKYREYDIDVVSEGNIEQSLKRRDFTINSMALQLKTGRLLDPHRGRADLTNRQIRALPGALAADPQRVYRAARFSAQLGDNSREVRNRFSIVPSTREQMYRVRKGLAGISRERVFEELKSALQSSDPSAFFLELKIAGVLHPHFEEIAALIGVEQSTRYHPEGDVFNHTMLSLQAVVPLRSDPLVRFAVLVHDLGKALTPREEWPHHYRHDLRGIEPLVRLCRRLGLPVRWEKAGRLAINEHMLGYKWRGMKPGKIVRLFTRAARSPLGVSGLEAVIKADRCGRAGAEQQLPLVSGLTRTAERLFREVTGSMINLPEGPELGERLFQERCHWIKEHVKKTADGDEKINKK